MLLVVYVAFVGILYAMMRQTPDRFATFMSRLPDPVLLITPFPPLWEKAREGVLRIGDSAPEFLLETADHSRTVALSSFRGEKPVVLVFGSYT